MIWLLWLGCLLGVLVFRGCYDIVSWAVAIWLGVIAFWFGVIAGFRFGLVVCVSCVGYLIWLAGYVAYCIVDWLGWVGSDLLFVGGLLRVCLYYGVC